MVGVNLPTSQKETTGISVPSVCSEGLTDLVSKVQIGNESYDFVVDSRENLNLFRPYVGEGVHSSVEHLVRGVTGNLLRTHGSRYIEFQLERNTYHR